MTWRLGVAGSPVAHSRSPELHELGLRLAGLEGTSSRVELGEGDGVALRALFGTRFDALSITRPLKSIAYEICDERSEAAARTGSVNSLWWREGRLYGESTDGQGLLDALRGELGVEVDNAHVVVLGAGGAARSIVDALVEGEVSSVVVHSSDRAAAGQLAAHYQNVFTQSLVYRPIDVVVNTRPPDVRRSEVDVLQGVRPDSVAVDLAYDPATTPWRELYERAGCRTMNGLAMLAYQAALQLGWWFGRDLDGATLLAAMA